MQPYYTKAAVIQAEAFLDATAASNSGNQQQRLVSNRSRHLSGQTTNSNLEMNFETSRIGKKVIEFQNVDFAYDQEKPILTWFNLNPEQDLH